MLPEMRPSCECFTSEKQRAPLTSLVKETKESPGAGFFLPVCPLEGAHEAITAIPRAQISLRLTCSRGLPADGAQVLGKDFSSSSRSHP